MVKELVVSWWNCRLSPPLGSAKKYAITKGFESVIVSMLESRGSDILGLCEVDLDSVKYIQNLLLRPGLDHFKVFSLYRAGKSVDDLCLIYNSNKLSLVGSPIDANARDDVYDDWLKAGVFVGFELKGGSQLYVGLSHWQSRQTIPERSPVRLKLGLALRATIRRIRKSVPDCLVILCGDYNDEPFDDSVVHGVGATRDVTILEKKPNVMFNPFWPLMGSQCSNSFPPGTYISAGKVSSMMMFDHIMLSSSIIKCWDVLDRVVINGVPPREWRKISDHYPVSVHIQRAVL